MSSSGSIGWIILFIWPRLLHAPVLRFLLPRWPPFPGSFVPAPDALSAPCERETGANARCSQEDSGGTRSPHNSVVHTRAASGSRVRIRPISPTPDGSTERNLAPLVSQAPEPVRLAASLLRACAAPPPASSSQCRRDKCGTELSARIERMPE